MLALLLTLGGADDVRGLPSNEGLSNERIMGTAEYRWTLFRHASIPSPLVWISELRLAPALDVGVGWRGDERVAAVGANLGAYVTLDNLGALPALSGATVAVPLWTEGVEAGAPQFYIEFEHAF